MGKSAAFARIKGEVFGVVRKIPRGRVCTFAEIGRHLDVMARHVAYILAMLTDDERADVPWYRVVSEAGVINRSKHGRAGEQSRRLEAEGVAVAPGGAVADFDALIWLPD